MSSHLLPVKTGNEQIPVQYRNLLVDSFTPSASLVMVHDSMAYVLFQNKSSPYSAPLYRINMFTGESQLVHTFTTSDMGNIMVGSMLMDDNYLYLIASATASSSSISRTIVVFSYEEDANQQLTFTKVTTSTDSVATNGFGKAVWYDRNKILVPYANGFMLFDPEYFIYTKYKRSDTSVDYKDIAVGDKLVMMTNASTSADTVFAYRKDTDEFFTITLPTTDPCVVCYDNKRKRFYFANTGYLYTYDETTETLLSTRNLPWTNPYSISYTNGGVIVTQTSSTRVYIYDVDFDQTISFLLRWTMPALSIYYPTQISILDGFWLCARNTLCITDYSGYSKYNFGHKYETFTLLFNTQTESQFTYDSRFVTFGGTWMKVHDGDINLNMVSDPTLPNVKRAHVIRSTYKFLNELKITWRGSENQ